MRVLHHGIAGNAPALVADDSAALFACRLCVVLVAVIQKKLRVWLACVRLREVQQIPGPCSSAELSLTGAYGGRHADSILRVTFNCD
jgi:hypothetical protein